jgi:hypothetical protein
MRRAFGGATMCSSTKEAVMSTYQIVLSNAASAIEGIRPARLYERFLGWWVSLYAPAPRKLHPMI